jgi:hypothetical protein
MDYYGTLLPGPSWDVTCSTCGGLGLGNWCRTCDEKTLTDNLTYLNSAANSVAHFILQHATRTRQVLMDHCIEHLFEFKDQFFVEFSWSL